MNTGSNSAKTSSDKTRMLCEGAVCVALSLALSFIKIPLGFSFGGFGGSVDLVMIPIIVFAVRWGCGWGIISGLAFGTLKFFVANGFAVNWASMFLDYAIAYAFVGFAGLLRKKYELLPVAALIGSIGRFCVHYVSGITIYAMYMPEEFMGLEMNAAAIYSLLYNGSYMLPNTLLAVIICLLIRKTVSKI